MPEGKPRHPIRRFDVFAEYNRVRNLKKGMPADQAKGRAIWLAKVVASRRGIPSGKEGAAGGERGERLEEREEEKFYSLGGEEQTDLTFDREIIDRMGPEFYRETFSPAIERAFQEGQRYEDIRDAIRKGWK